MQYNYGEANYTPLGFLLALQIKYARTNIASSTGATIETAKIVVLFLGDGVPVVLQTSPSDLYLKLDGNNRSGFTLVQNNTIR